MPKLRPAEALERLGHRLRARRVFLQLPLSHTAEEMQLTKGVLLQYELGRGHPPCLTLLRMAKVLGTTTSMLLIERDWPRGGEDVDRAVELCADPAIYEVASAMRRMDAANRQAVVTGIREMII